MSSNRWLKNRRGQKFLWAKKLKWAISLFFIIFSIIIKRNSNTCRRQYLDVFGQQNLPTRPLRLGLGPELGRVLRAPDFRHKIRSVKNCAPFAKRLRRIFQSKTSLKANNWTLRIQSVLISFGIVWVATAWIVISETENRSKYWTWDACFVQNQPLVLCMQDFHYQKPKFWFSINGSNWKIGY